MLSYKNVIILQHFDTEVYPNIEMNRFFIPHIGMRFHTLRDTFHNNTILHTPQSYGLSNSVSD